MSRFKEFSSSNNSPNKTTRKKSLLSLIALIVALLAVPIRAAAGGVTPGKETSSNNIYTLPPSHALTISSSCSSTLYPELCYSSVTESLLEDKKVTSVNITKDVIIVSLNVTIKAVQRIEKLLAAAGSGSNLTEREKTALNDCMETLDETVDELQTAVNDLEAYPSKKSIQQHADDLKTLLSSAITNQETCLDGFSHGATDKHVREILVGGQVLRVERLCSNSLAMITNMTQTDMDNQNKLNGGRKLAAEDGDNWPEWITAGDRRLLQSPTVMPDVVVAADGSGNHRTVSAAVAAAPERSSRRYVIRIKAGVYRENVEVGKRKTNIMFMGDGRRTTIITGSRNVQDGSTTFNSATVAVVGERFLARDITFQNTAGPSKHQAVALRVGSDLSAFYRCDMLAYQDTLYVHNNRQYFVQCLISGTVDFIFGNAAAVFQDCDIHARRPNPGQRNMVTAQGRTDPNQNTGIVIHRCRIGATSDLRPVQGTFPTYLGRPWKEYSRTVVMQSVITDVVHPAGWHEWSGNFALNTLFYAEYQNTGAGAGRSGRVGWRGVRAIASANEAQSYTAGRFIAGGSWLSSTGFPFNLGL